MSDRQDFLRRAGWGNAEIAPLPGDASTRHYARLHQNGRRAMLMDQPQAAEMAVAPPDADETTRRALGYNAVARLAGADCRRFTAVADYLRARGLGAPAIHAADHSHGWLVLEDFGDTLFTDVLTQGVSEEELYKAAVEVLAKLHQEPAPDLLAPGLPLFAYDDVALIAETDLMLEWFLPLALGRKATEVEYREHRGLWRAALNAIADSEPVFVHRDYHAQNLMWLP
ncbi:MAG: aminoglycoside phosphotransferase family protein, partial [Rhizomicrobium sp.]